MPRRSGSASRTAVYASRLDEWTRPPGRQHPIERFIIDCCDEAKLCIEAACPVVSGVDGDSHAEQIEYDEARTAYLNELGYTVIRFTNREVFNQCEAVLHHIAEGCERIVEDAAV